MVVPWVAKIQGGDGAFFERARRAAAQSVYRRADSATSLCDFFVACASDALFVFLGAAAGENQMRVRIDEAWQNDASGEINLFGTARFAQFLDAAAWTDGRDAVFADQDCAVADDAEVAERFAAAGNGTAQSQQLRAAGDEQVGHGCSDTNAVGD